MSDLPVIALRGGGDLGSACALRLTRSGLRVVIVERAVPTAVRRTVAFSEAVFDGSAEVEGLVATLISHPDCAEDVWSRARVPIVVDPGLQFVLLLSPAALVDATLAKENFDMHRGLAPATVALGPGFAAGVDVDAVVETNRGPDLGRVIWQGEATKNTHSPGPVAGHTHDRVLRAPAAGRFRAHVDIGTILEASQTIADVDGMSIRAPFQGMLRGLLRSGVSVTAHMKVGDIDPRIDPSLCWRVSDKALAIAGGVVEAIFMLLGQQGWHLDSGRSSVTAEGAFDAPAGRSVRAPTPGEFPA